MSSGVAQGTPLLGSGQQHGLTPVPPTVGVPPPACEWVCPQHVRLSVWRVVACAAACLQEAGCSGDVGTFSKMGHSPPHTAPHATWSLTLSLSTRYAQPQMPSISPVHTLSRVGTPHHIHPTAPQPPPHSTTQTGAHTALPVQAHPALSTAQSPSPHSSTLWPGR